MLENTKTVFFLMLHFNETRFGLIEPIKNRGAITLLVIRAICLRLRGHHDKIDRRRRKSVRLLHIIMVKYSVIEHKHAFTLFTLGDLIFFWGGAMSMNKK